MYIYTYVLFSQFEASSRIIFVLSFLHQSLSTTRSFHHKKPFKFLASLLGRTKLWLMHLQALTFSNIWRF